MSVMKEKAQIMLTNIRLINNMSSIKIVSSWIKKLYSNQGLNHRNAK